MTVRTVPPQVWQTGQTITHHAGQTGGYASCLCLDRPDTKPSSPCPTFANDANNFGTQLLAKAQVLGGP